MRVFAKIIKWLFIIVVLTLTSFAFAKKANYEDFDNFKGIFARPCSKPVSYSVGTVDRKFNLSEDELLSLAEEAENVWEKETNRSLFQYDPNSNFKINLIFDERQRQSIESERLDRELKQLEQSRNKISDEYDSLQSSYEKKMKEYESGLNEYESRLKEYNKDVEYWNSRGGAPEDEYDELEKERKRLEDAQKDLESQRKEINKIVAQANNLSAQEKAIVDEYNADLSTFRNKYVGAREFEKGFFDGKEINIYQFQAKDDLRLTLVHEFGHALGIGHVENPVSIMYYLMENQDMDNPKLTKEDLEAVGEVCRL